MAKSGVVFTQDNEYYTPKSVVQRFGLFDYDPATTADKAKDLGISNFDTIESDGLNKNWSSYERIWINPPFTIKHLFLAKAWETYKEVKNDIYCLFPIEFLTTKRFHNIGAKGVLYLPNGRIQFESGLGKPSKSPAFGCVIMKLADDFSIQTMEL
jgi:hypothetical protein